MSYPISNPFFMAKIILEPGEVFEHFHSESSQTVLLEGRVQMAFGEKMIPLVVNQAVNVPAQQSHTLTNSGATDAVVWCTH
jgi:mannose-6-phosphate isomerase-like protein (cupin superfamily)